MAHEYTNSVQMTTCRLAAMTPRGLREPPIHPVGSANKPIKGLLKFLGNYSVGRGVGRGDVRRAHEIVVFRDTHEDTQKVLAGVLAGVMRFGALWAAPVAPANNLGPIGSY